MKTVCLLCFVCISAAAQVQPPTYMIPRYLDKNKVKASIYTCNNKFWDVYGSGVQRYEVPKGKGSHAQFGNCIWIGGFDNSNILHMSANTYKQNGTDFWPGPLDT